MVFCFETHSKIGWSGRWKLRYYKLYWKPNPTLIHMCRFIRLEYMLTLCSIWIPSTSSCILWHNTSPLNLLFIVTRRKRLNLKDRMALVCMYKYNFNVHRILSNISCIKSINFLRPHSWYDVIFLILNSTTIGIVRLSLKSFLQVQALL